MTLDELISQTRAHAMSTEPLPLLAAAAHQQQELTDLGEKLLDHFVQEARIAGCSWSQIGTALGISKQAAQQRHSMLRSLIEKFTGGVESLRNVVKRFSSQARHAVVLGQDEARRMHHDHMGTEHLLLGLLAEGEGTAAQALQQAGITLDTVRAEIAELLPPSQEKPQGHIPFTPRAKKVLEQALRESLQLRHRRLGTEHILLGLLRETDGVAAQVLVKLGTDLNQLRESILALLSTQRSGDRLQ